MIINGCSLIQGNCLDMLVKLPDQSLDLVITSPPYNMNLRIRNGKYCSRQIVKELSTKYVDFDDNLPIEEYYEFNRQVILELLRVSKLSFINIQFLTGNKRALFKLIGYFHEYIKEFIIWDKINAEPAIGAGVLNSQYEVLLVVTANNAISRKFDTAAFDRGTLSNVWAIKRGKKPTNLHGAVFPIELVEKILLNFSKSGDIICDPFMGTGSTGIACLNTDRKFLGIELSETYFNLAKDRINDHDPTNRESS